MKILVDVLHPAHVHLYRNAMRQLEKRGHEIFCTARAREMVSYLLEKYGFKYKILTFPKRGQVNLVRELLEHDFKLFKIVKSFKPNIMVGSSLCIAHVSKITSPKSIIFNEDDAAVLKTSAKVYFPFADIICTPDCVKDDFGRKHIKYNSYHELAYLHPDNFLPTSDVLKKLEVNENERYFIIRFVAFQAGHDVRERGLDFYTTQKIIDILLKYGKVFISSEKKLLPEFEKYKIPISPDEMHDALYFATMYIGDSQTMTAEAAVLGTPAIRCNTFVGRISYLEELEHRYELTYGFLPDESGKMLNKIAALLEEKELKSMWKEKKDKMLKEKMNLVYWMTNFIENYHEFL